MKNRISQLIILSLIASILGCGDPIDTISANDVNYVPEIANQLGAMMAAADEPSRGTANVVSLPRTEIKKSAQPIYELLFPQAQAATCALTQGTCSSNVVTRNFSGCTIGGYVLTGQTRTSWSGGSSCTLSSAGQYIQVEPNYSVSANNITLSESTTGPFGIKMTWASGSVASRIMQFTNDGTRRLITSNGSTLLDLTTTTLSAMTIVGQTRGARTMTSSAGALQMINGLSGETCTFQANSLSWGSASCNCPTTGSWSGSCTSAGSMSLTLTGCGTGTMSYTESGTPKTASVSLDRCGT